MVIFIYSRNEKKCAVGAGQIVKIKKEGWNPCQSYNRKRCG